MTVSVTTNENSYTAAGTASETFTVSFYFLATGDLHVFLAGTKQTEGTNYSVTGAGDLTGGTVTWIGTPTASATVRIIRIVAPTQGTDYQATGSFPAESHEEALDRLTMIAQQSLRLDGTSGDKWDAGALTDPAGTRIIQNVTDPTAAQEVATKAFVDAQVIAAGSLPAPVGADTDKVLTATGADAATWLFRGIKPPVSGDLTPNFVLEAQSAADDGWDWSDRGVPIPVAADLRRILVPLTAAKGGYAYQRVPSRNLVLNGGFRVFQRGTSFTSATTPANSDDTYLADQWILLSDGNDRVDVTREIDESILDDGMQAAIRLDVETVSGTSEKFGILQLIENKNARALVGQTVSLSFKARKTGSEPTNLRAGVVCWDDEGNIDVVTSDIVSAWGASGTNPTLVTNWTFADTPADLTDLTTSFQTFRIEGISVPSQVSSRDVVNMGVFIWMDDTDLVAGNFIYITEVRLELGSISFPYNYEDITTELDACRRYWQQSYNQGVAPATVTDVGALHTSSTGTSATDATIDVRFNPTMRSAPTVVIYNPGTGTVDEMEDSAPTNRSAISADIGDGGCRISNDVAITDSLLHRVHFTATAEL